MTRLRMHHHTRSCRRRTLEGQEVGIDKAEGSMLQNRVVVVRPTRVVWAIGEAARGQALAVDFPRHLGEAGRFS